MPNAGRPSTRTSHAKGLTGAGEDAPLPNEDRIIAGPDGPERVSGGHVATASPVYDAHLDSGRHTTGDKPPYSARGDERPDRQNDMGEMADSVG